ncbi:MAG: HD domain-containing phosphohydrolase [Candidatus Ozemobacteraceae bacterium]
MTQIIINIFLAVALVGLTYKYIELRDLHEREGIPDLTYIEGLSSILDAAEVYAAAHAREIAKEAETIGRFLGLPESSLVSLRIAALLHDCGQVQIPRELLKKTHPLSSEEWFLLKTHPLIGEMALRKALPAHDEVPSLVRWHHERWDGTGYPDHLAGEEIPLGARILAVADAANAMSQDRPHRPAFNAARIDTDLEKMAGLMFDPKIVRARIEARKLGGS